MQEDEKSQDWQQPQDVGTAAPYQATAEEPVGAEPSGQEVAPQEDAPIESPDDTQSSQDEPHDDLDASDDSVIQWQASEYIQHDRSAKWFILLALVSLILIAIALFLMQSVSFAILVPVMAAALVIYVRRPPGVIDYVVSRKGVHVNDKLHTYDEFRSFGVLSHDGFHSVVLLPRKRFQLSQTMYFPEEVGEDLVDMLAARLPMNEVKQDAIDHFLARLRL